MKSRRCALVLLDAMGHSLRRYTLSRASIAALMAAGGCVALVCLILILSSPWVVSTAFESQRMARENRQLRHALNHLSEQLTGTAELHGLVQQRFVQLWERSNLSATLPYQHLATAPMRTPSALSAEADQLHATAAKQLDQLADLLDYFHDAHFLLSSTPSIKPAPAARMSSHFGKRSDPIHQRWVLHKGIDLSGYPGMEIYAPADGVVIWTGVRGGYGRTVVLDHGAGLQSHFAHLRRWLVQPGDRVKRGDLIAEMGNTGRSTGPHLHYEVRRYGQPLNPLNFILD